MADVGLRLRKGSLLTAIWWVCGKATCCKEGQRSSTFQQLCRRNTFGRSREIPLSTLTVQVAECWPLRISWFPQDARSWQRQDSKLGHPDSQRTLRTAMQHSLPSLFMTIKPRRIFGTFQRKVESTVSVGRSVGQQVWKSDCPWNVHRCVLCTFPAVEGGIREGCVGENLRSLPEWVASRRQSSAGTAWQWFRTPSHLFFFSFVGGEVMPSDQPTSLLPIEGQTSAEAEATEVQEGLRGWGGWGFGGGWGLHYGRGSVDAGPQIKAVCTTSVFLSFLFIYLEHLYPAFQLCKTQYPRRHM